MLREPSSETPTVKVTSVLKGIDYAVVLGEGTSVDDKALTTLGYKPEFKRDFSLWECFAVSFSVLGLLPSVATTIAYSLGYSGTGGAIWGWLIAGFAVQATALSLAELCSSMPTVGGLYYAAAALAPDGWGPVCSWFVGFSNLCGYATGPCSVNYAMAAMLVTCGQIAYPDYQPQTWHVYLTLLAILVANGLIAMQSTRFIGWVNQFGTIWNVAVLCAFVVWFPAGSIHEPKTNADHATVWTSFENGTAWPIGWSTIMGFLTTMFTMCGYDAPFHLVEECSNASIAAPRAIVMTAQLGLYLGWFVILVIAYTVKDIAEVVAGAYNQPFGSLCLQVLGPRAGLAMFALTVVAQFFVGEAITAAATRVVFAFARDGALPGSKIWSHVDGRTKTPVNATWGLMLISALLGLLMFAGPVVIAAVFSIGPIALYTSFTFPIALKLFFGRTKFQRGPWHLGRWSVPLNTVACCWWVIIVPALCFPAVSGADLTPLTMNWTCLIYGGTMALAMGYYVLDARKWFQGPRLNVSPIDEGAGPQTTAFTHDRTAG